MLDPRTRLGRLGEKHARRHLRSLGYRIVTRNYRCPVGELDIVALHGATIVFVEVKTRSHADHDDPRQLVTPDQRRSLTHSARWFLQQTRSQHRPCRFDLIALTCAADRITRVEHLPNAFAPAG